MGTVASLVLLSGIDKMTEDDQHHVKVSTTIAVWAVVQLLVGWGGDGGDGEGGMAHLGGAGRLSNGWSII